MSVLFKKLANELIDGNGDIKMIPSNQKINNTIIDMMRSIRYENDVQLITNDDKKGIFSGLNELNLILNESDVENCVFNQNNLFMRIDHRLDALVKMLKYGDYNSENIFLHKRISLWISIYF